MEETTGDNNSDSDSVDSWTIVDKKMNESIGGTPKQQSNNAKPNDCETNRNVEEDGDTDGVSVISDEEPENPEEATAAPKIPIKIDPDSTLCHHNEKIDIPIHDISQNEFKYQYQFAKKEPVNDSDTASVRGSEEELSDDFFSKSKVRSYIHKRNNKLSGILNMILVGTVITTACVAVGHMWGTTDDCSPDMFSSLSQLVYNMQELQHENYILKSKVKVLESKFVRQSQLPLPPAYYKKLSQRFTELVTKEEIENFLNQEKADCQCVDNIDKVERVPDVSQALDLDDNSIPQIANKSEVSDLDVGELANDVSEGTNLNSVDYLSKSYAVRKNLEQLESFDRAEKSSIRKREIPSGHNNNFVGPKMFDVFIAGDSEAPQYNTKQHKQLNYPRNNASNVNKKYATREKKKSEKYNAKEASNHRNKENEKFRKNSEKKQYKNAGVNADDRYFKSPISNQKDREVYFEANEKFRDKMYKKDARKDKYKMKGYKLKKVDNSQYKDHEHKKDIHKSEFVKKEKRFLKV